MSISQNRSEAVRKYFTKTPHQPDLPDYSSHHKKMTNGGILLFIAIILFFSQIGFFIFLGIVLVYYGYKYLKNGALEYSDKKQRYEKDLEQYTKDYAAAEPKPSDEEIDQWINADIDSILEESRRKLDLEEGDYKTKPLVLGGPADLNETLYAFGRDGKVRYSHINVLIVYLSDHNILTYQCTHNLIYGQTLTDNTQEFPYKEITNLQIKTVNKDIFIVNGRRDSVNGVQQFALYTSGGNVIEVIYSFTQNTDQQNEFVKIGSQNTIRSVRKKLEEYKKKYEK